MRIQVTKPRAGKVDIRLLDRRGLTGLYQERLGVELDQVGAVAGQLAGTWHSRRDAIEVARKGLTP